jgi:cytidylate kinase
MQIAVDGGAGVGKSTVARLLAERLDISYVNTGAMYRAIAWAVDAGLNLDNVDIDSDGDEIWVNGENIGQRLYNERIDDLSSQLSSKPEVRQKLVSLQQQIATRKSVVMEGRDIGTVVLPDADLKVYLTASVEERARRRADQRAESFEVIKQMIVERDERDRQGHGRQPASNAVYIDTTSLDAQGVVDEIIKYLEN